MSNNNENSGPKVVSPTKNRTAKGVTPKGFLVGGIHSELVDRVPISEYTPMFDFDETSKNGRSVIIVKIKDKIFSDAKQRSLRSQIIPDILRLTRTLTPEEYDANHVHTVRPEIPYYLEGVKGDTTPLAQYLPCDHVQAIPGLMNIMTEMQAIILDPDIGAALAKLNTGKHGDLSSYTTGITIQPSGHADTVQLSQIAKARPSTSMKEPNIYLQENITRFNQLVGMLAAIVIPRAFPDETKDWDKLWESSGSLTIGGDESNRYITSVFINVCKVDTDTHKEPSLRDAIGGKSDLHCDTGDETSMISMNLFLSYLPKWVFPGRFFMPLLKMEVSGAPFGLLLFKGTYPHIPLAVGNYIVPHDSSLRYRAPIGFKYPPSDPNWTYQRISIIMYPKSVLMNVGTPKRLHPCLSGEVKEKDWKKPDLSQEKQQDFKSKLESWAIPAALVFWGTLRNLNTWKMRLDIRKNLQQYRAEKTTAMTLAKKFAWVEAGSAEKCMPSINIAQACLDATRAESAKLIAAKKIIKSVNIGRGFIHRLPDGSLSSASSIAHITWFSLPGAEKSKELMAVSENAEAVVEYSEEPKPKTPKRTKAGKKDSKPTQDDAEARLNADEDMDEDMLSEDDGEEDTDMGESPSKRVKSL